jgi:hypothetical protein
MEYLLSATFRDRFQTILAKIRLGWKGYQGQTFQLIRPLLY